MGAKGDGNDGAGMYECFLYGGRIGWGRVGEDNRSDVGEVLCYGWESVSRASKQRVPYTDFLSLVHRGVSDERLKIISFTTHYPVTYTDQDQTKGWLVSLYFTGWCVRPANDTGVGSCGDRTVWRAFDFDSSLREIDGLNGSPRNGSTKVVDSFETKALRGVMPRVDTCVPFFLLIGAILLHVPMFVLVVGRRSALKSAFCVMLVGYAAEMVGAVWVTAVAYSTKRSIDKLDRTLVREAKIGVGFMALLWCAVLTSLVCVGCTTAHVFVWRGMSEEQRRADTQMRTDREMANREAWRDVG